MTSSATAYSGIPFDFQMRLFQLNLSIVFLGPSMQNLVVAFQFYYSRSPDHSKSKIAFLLRNHDVRVLISALRPAVLTELFVFFLELCRHFWLRRFIPCPLLLNIHWSPIGQNYIRVLLVADSVMKWTINEISHSIRRVPHASEKVSLNKWKSKQLNLLSPPYHILKFRRTSKMYTMPIFLSAIMCYLYPCLMEDIFCPQDVLWQ
jgi:hypothetical protein